MGWKDSPTQIAVFGGSFNPPHMAHVQIVAWLLSTGQADEVWMVPCWRHMFGKRLAPFRHRLEMCRSAAGIFSRCSVSDIEHTLGGKSLMLRILRALRAKPIFPKQELSLVIGLDNWLVRDKWESFEELRQEFPIIVVGKEGQPKLPEIRSTMVRNMVAAGEDVSQLVPSGVLSHITKNGLYLPKAKG